MRKPPESSNGGERLLLRTWPFHGAATETTQGYWIGHEGRCALAFEILSSIIEDE